MVRIRRDVIRVLAAGETMLAAQSDFNAAKAARDDARIADAAFEMLVASAAAAFWSAMLDREVAPADTSAEVDAQAAELRALAAGVSQRVAPIVEARDSTALTARLGLPADAPPRRRDRRRARPGRRLRRQSDADPAGRRMRGA